MTPLLLIKYFTSFISFKILFCLGEKYFSFGLVIAPGDYMILGAHYRLSELLINPHLLPSGKILF